MNLISHKIGELKLTYEPITDSLQICNSHSAYRFLLSHWDMDLIDLQEQFVVLFLNRYSQVITWRKINTGKRGEVQVDRKLIYALSASLYADFVIICHNHPYLGQKRPEIPKPSKEDERLTGAITRELEMLGVCVRDSLIINRDTFYSFADHPENAMLVCGWGDRED